MNRMSLTATPAWALLAGQLGGALVLSLFQSVVFVLVGLGGGADIEAGVGGAFVLVALSVITALAFGALGLVAALRTGSGEAVQGQGLLLFILLFFSSMNLPRDLIEIEWFRVAATLNPVSYMIEGLRSLVISGWDAQALALGFGVAAGLTVAALAGSALALRQRMART